ncbi:ABC transporter ATP-binding protein [Aquibacillus koreensis]|uniref:ABC transporter ATP-binding protein n=1 Tax=Aquibacillus koreensis TaxID=279446 RepID=A0A9X3WMA3_9BACI|nr:ABC transporter ATP-binding protein [Aquibacillus koreensis]MCT2537151.1 ABC transporter ATP-binding protein [Aquibacillus koreensis]MDC3419866.1 ABC transporter ATP-binding protein [Aquibacillus koreensis]
MSFIKINSLTSGYSNTVIIRNIDIEVNEGEVLCLLGRNGVGKTTLLKTIMGLLPTLDGECFVMDRKVSGLKPYQIANLRVSYAPQDMGIFPDLSVGKNLKVGYRGSTSNFEEGCEEAFVHFPILKERLTQRAGTLSGGEKKMLILSRCIVNQPRLLILDEITEGVQPSIIDKFSDALNDIKKKGTTILLVEQNVSFAEKVADFYAVMNQGEIVAMDQMGRGSKQKIESYLVI